MILLLIPAFLLIVESAANLGANRGPGRFIRLASLAFMFVWLLAYTNPFGFSDPDARRVWFVALVLGLETLRAGLAASPNRQVGRLGWLPAIQNLALFLAFTVIPLPPYASAPVFIVSAALVPVGFRIWKGAPPIQGAAKFIKVLSVLMGFFAMLFPFIDRNWLPASAFAVSLGGFLLVFSDLGEFFNRKVAPQQEVGVPWRHLGLLLLLAGSVPHFLQFD
ncbi:MAG: hypothetical protein HYZ26_10810 [Chloroflexi bacterium]|nr:hypothetical protein [Chloroflexota bacterium]